MIKNRWFACAFPLVVISSWAGMNVDDLKSPADYPVVVVATVMAVHGESHTNASPPTFSILVDQKLKSGKFSEFLESVFVTLNDIDYVGGDSEKRLKEWKDRPVQAPSVNSRWIFSGEIDGSGRFRIYKRTVYSEESVLTIRNLIKKDEQRPRIEINPESCELTLPSGGSGVCAFTVRNKGGTEATYRMIFEGMLAWPLDDKPGDTSWISTKDYSNGVTLPPGVTKKLLLPIYVPRERQFATPGKSYEGSVCLSDSIHALGDAQCVTISVTVAP